MLPVVVLAGNFVSCYVVLLVLFSVFLMQRQGRISEVIRTSSSRSNTNNSCRRSSSRLQRQILSRCRTHHSCNSYRCRRRTRPPRQIRERNSKVKCRSTYRTSSNNYVNTSLPPCVSRNACRLSNRYRCRSSTSSTKDITMLRPRRTNRMTRSKSSVKRRATLLSTRFIKYPSLTRPMRVSRRQKYRRNRRVRRNGRRRLMRRQRR